MGEINFANEDINDAINFYNSTIGYDVYGERIGCKLEDEPSGKLTFNVGLVSFDKKAITFSVNVRCPISYKSEDFYEPMSEILDKYEVGVVKLSDEAPIYFEPDSPLVETLVGIYRENTGDMSPPIVIGGGTYARSMENCIAFGALFPGDPDLMHQRDERLALDRLETMTKIYADAIYKLTQPGFEL